MRGIVRIVIFAVALVLAVRWELPRLEEYLASGTSSGYSSRTAASPTRKLSVLFIGDSYIFVNNLPKMLTDIASSDPGNTIEIDTQSVTRGGAHLSELLQAGDATKMINSKHWDYVVLQEQSTWYLDEDEVNKTFDAAGSFAREIRAAGATPVIYQTWIREPGTSWYAPPFVAATQSPDYMQRQLDNDSTLLGKSIDAPVVLAGDAWDSALKNDSTLLLYANDGSHPSPAGTYLVGLMFYRFFTGNKVDQLGYLPDGVTAKDKVYLQQLVDGY